MYLDKVVHQLTDGNGLLAFDAETPCHQALNLPPGPHEYLEEGLLEGGIELEEACSLGKVDGVLEVGVVLDDWGGCVADKLQGQHWMVEVEEVLREEGYVVGVDIVGCRVHLCRVDDCRLCR